MRAGERQALLSVMKAGQGVNEHNEPVPAWVLHGRMWGQLFPLRGYERESGNERQSVAVYRCRVDYLEGRDVTADMKVEFDGLQFNIIAVHHDLVSRRTTDFMLGESPRGA